MLNIAVYLLLSLTFVVLSSLLFVYLFKKNNARFEHVLPISLMSTALLMFLLTALIHNIQIAFVITIALQLIGLAVFIILDKTRKQTVVQFLKSPAIIVFALLLVALFVINYGRILTGFDDLIHWGPFVADMLRINDFYNASSNIAFSVHGDYPPAAAMFEVFYLKLTGNEVWLMFVASQLLCLSMLFPLFSTFVWRKKANRVVALNVLVVLGLIIAGLLSVTLQANSAFFYEIRIDTLLACAGAYGIFTAFTEGKKFRVSTVIKLSILVTFILLLKQVALVMAVVVVTIYIAMLFMHRENNDLFTRPVRFLKKIKVMYAVIAVIALLLPLISLKVWNVQVDRCLTDNVCTKQFSSEGIKFLEIPSIVLKQSGSGLEQETASHFLKYVYTGDTLISSDVLKLTYPQFILLFIGVMACLAVYAHRTKQGITGVLVVTGVLLVGYFGYLFLLLGTYLYGGFSVGEMQILASADRYIGTYILMMILVALMVFVYLWSKGNQGKTTAFIPGAITLIVFCLLLNPHAYKSVLPFHFLSYSEIDNMKDFKLPIDEVATTIKSDKDYTELSIVVFAECSEQAGLWESNYLRYQVRPNPYLVLFNKDDEQFIRNIDYRAAVPYVDPAGRANTNSEGDISVYVVAICSGVELEKYNAQLANLIQFDTTVGIKEKWQVFKTTTKGDFYNTLDQELIDLKAI